MKKSFGLILIVLSLLVAQSTPAFALGFDVSLAASYSRSNFGPKSYSWTRRYSMGIGYMLLPVTELEFSYQDVAYRNKIANTEDTLFQDKIYSLNIVQYLASRKFPVQPFLKLGFGQLNRDASGTYAGGYRPVARYDALTAIIGAGLKIFLTRSFSVNGEATSYLTGGRISSWKDNVGANLGTSFYF